MQYRNTAIFSDLDGTLFRSDSVIGKKNREAIRLYTEAGGLFAIATGRSYPNALYYMKTVVPNAPSIVYNGSGVFDPKTGDYPYRVHVDQDAMLKVLLWCRKRLPGLDIQVYGEQMTYYVSPRETAERRLVEQLLPCEFRAIEEVQSLPWFKALLYGTPPEIAALNAYLADQRLDERLAVVRAITGIPPYYEHIELLPKNVNKGTALDACRALPCFTGRTLIGVGDYTNDYELLAAADVACCPSNANDAIQKICDHILVSNDEEAIADLILSVIPALPE